jgi:hypothetical protein
MSGKCGFVFKEGAQIYSWKKRFLCIEPEQGKISYYVKDDRKTKKGEIVIKTIKAVKRYNDYKGRKFVFGVITTTGRTFFIQAADDESVESWMNAIKDVAGLNAPVAHTPQTATPPPKPTAYTPAPTPAATSAPPQVEKVTVDDFETLKVIGRGGFGRVLLVRKKDTKKVHCTMCELTS